MQIKDDLGSYINLPSDANQAANINAVHPSADLTLCSWEATGDGWFNLMVTRNSTGAGDVPLEFRGIATDTYGSATDDAYADFTLTLKPL